MAEIIVQTIVEDCANSINDQVTTVADLYDVPSPENETVSTKRPQSSETNLADKTSFVAEHPSHSAGYDMDENAVEQGGFPTFDRRTSAKAVRARKIQMDQDIEDCLKVLTRLRLASASVAKHRNTKTSSSCFDPDVDSKPAMSCVAQNQHREKHVAPLFNAMVAAPLKNWKTNPVALAALQTEYAHCRCLG